MVIFEHKHRDDTWRLQLTDNRGRKALDWRRWFRVPAGGEVRTRDGKVYFGGQLAPTRFGVTMPPGRARELLAGIEAALAALPPENGS